MAGDLCSSPEAKRARADTGAPTPANTPRPADGSATPSVCSGLATPIPMDEDGHVDAQSLCNKCNLPVLAADRGVLGNTRSKQVVHRLCVTAYKRRCRQNSKNRALKAAWEAMSNEDSIEWYRKNAIPELEDTDRAAHEQTISQVNSVDTSQHELHVAIPFSVFQDRGEMKSWSAERIMTAWKKMLVDPRHNKIKAHGQICIVEFQGVEFRAGQSQSSAQEVRRTEAISTADDFQRAKATADKHMAGARQGMQAWAAKVQGHVCLPAALDLPEDLIDGLLDSDDIKLPSDSDFMNEVQRVVSKEARRLELLDSLMQEDLVDASIHCANLAGDQASTDKDIGALRARKISEFPKALEVWNFAFSDLQQQAASVVPGAKAKLGDDKLAAESFAELEKLEQSAQALRDEFKSKVDAAETLFHKATTSEELRDALDQLKAEKTNAKRPLAPFRRAIAHLKCMVKKRETGELKGLGKVSDLKDGASDGDQGALIIQHFTKHVCIDRGNFVNITEFDGESMDRLLPVFVSNKEFGSMPSEIKFLPALMIWLKEQLGGKASACVCFDKAKHSEPVIGFFSRMGSKIVFEKPFSALHTCLPSLFAVTLQRVTPAWSSAGFFPFGLGQWLAPVEGRLLVLGSPVDFVGGETFAEKTACLEGMGPEEWAKLAQSHGLAANISPGDLVWIPPGYMHRIMPIGDTTFFKWASAPVELNGGGGEFRKILSAATSMVSSFPSLGSKYAEWMSYLDCGSKAV